MDKYPISLQPVINTNHICIRCLHIIGVCKCDNPAKITISDYLHVDRSGQRTYVNKYKHLITEASDV